MEAGRAGPGQSLARTHSWGHPVPFSDPVACSAPGQEKQVREALETCVCGKVWLPPAPPQSASVALRKSDLLQIDLFGHFLPLK